jgi:hypothetical protein
MNTRNIERKGVGIMSELKATPGPWSHSGPPVREPSVFIYGGEHRGRIAKAEAGLNHGQDMFAEAIANAHLIAAAPDLYEALDCLVTNWSAFSYEEQGLALTAAAAALARARGETA